MNFRRQQGRPEFVKPQTRGHISSNRSTSAADNGQAVASFYASLVKPSPVGWVSGGTLQDGGEAGSRSSAAGAGPTPTSTAAGLDTTESAAAGPGVSAEQPSHAAQGSAAAVAEQEAERRQLEYNQPAGPWPQGEQPAALPAAAGGAEQGPLPRQEQPSALQQQQQQQQQQEGPRESIRYGISRSNVGFQLLKKAGWAEGSGLGAQEQGVAEPVAAFQQKGNLGLGYAPRPQSKARQQGGAANAAGLGAALERGGAAVQPSQQQQPKRALPEDALDKEDTDTKVKRVRQVMQAEADDKAGKAIARYIHMAFNDATGEPTRDTNPLLRRNQKLSATNPLL